MLLELPAAILYNSDITHSVMLLHCRVYVMFPDGAGINEQSDYITAATPFVHSFRGSRLTQLTAALHRDSGAAE